MPQEYGQGGKSSKAIKTLVTSWLNLRNLGMVVSWIHAGDTPRPFKAGQDTEVNAAAGMVRRVLAHQG